MAKKQSSKIGFKIETSSGLGEHATRGIKTPAKVPERDASFWLSRYGKRLSEAGGSLSVAGDSVVHRDPSGRVAKGSLSDVIDGRTVASLNVSAARLETAGYKPAVAVDMALNRLANYRSSPESSEDYQRKK